MDKQLLIDMGLIMLSYQHKCIELDLFPITPEEKMKILEQVLKEGRKKGWDILQTYVKKKNEL